MSAMPVVFTVRNAGGGTTGTPTAVVTGDFAIPAGGNKCAGGLNANATCTIDVIFKPGSAGGKNGTLTVSAPVGGMVVANLTGNGATTGLRITPETRDFGTAAVNATGTTVTFSVENNGGVAVSALMISVTGADFAIPMMGSKCGATLDVGAKCAVDVQFAPKAAGDRTGTLVATGTAGATAVSATAGLSGKAQSAARIIASTMTQAFAGAINTTSAVVNITIANVGDQTSGVPTVALAGTNAGEFSMTNGCITPLLGNGTCTVGIAFKPTSEGMKTASLTVTAMPGGTATVALTGLATDSRLMPAPASLMFADTSIPDTTAPQTITITNNGTAASGALNVTLGGVDASSFAFSSNTCQGAMVAMNGTCTIAVVFAPRTPPGQKSAIVSVTGTPGGTAAIMVTGNALSAPVVSVSPISFDYMTIPVNTTGSNTFTVTNTGGAPTGTLTTNLTGGAYFITANTCAAALLPMATCQVTVQFRPTVAGAFPGTLTVSSSAGGSQTVTLNGAASAATTLTVFQTGTMNTLFNFTQGAAPLGGGYVVGQQSAAQSFTITNTGASTTGMLSVTLAAPGNTDYVIVSNGCGELAPGVSCIVTVAFRPTATGLRSSSLVASGMGASGSATLTGTGLALLELVDAIAPFTPAEFDFGAVTIGVTSGVTQVFTANVRGNLGTLTGAVTAESMAGNFINVTITGCGNISTANPAAVGTWVTCAVNAQFAPKEPRTTTDKKSGTITVTAATAETATGTVTGTAAGPLTIVPTAGSFPNIAVGATSALEFNLTNNSAALTTIGPLTVTVTGPNAAEFQKTIDRCTGTSPAATAQCQAGAGPGNEDIVITFAPTSAGAKTATLTISGVVNPGGVASGVTETLTVNLVGNASSVVNITAAPTSLSFAATPAGGQSATQVVTITNPTGAPTTALAPAGVLSGTGQGDYAITGSTCLTTLGAGQTCTLTIRFNPAIAVTGTRTATLTINAGAGSTNSATVSLTGTVASALSVSPSPHNFGNVIVNDPSSPAQVFTLTNNTAAVFTITGTTIVAGTGANPQVGHFALTQGTPSCAGGSTINPGATCQVSIKFLPLLGPGTQTAELNIAGTVPTGATSVKVALTGTAVLDANLDLLAIADGATPLRDFGEVTIGGVDMRTVRFVLINSGGTTSSPITRVLNLNDTASGHVSAPIALSSEFTLAGGGCTEGQTLAAGESCNLDVVFQPAMAGQRRATLQIQANGLRGGNTGKVFLEGDGVNAATLHIDATNGHDLGATFAGVAPAAGVDFTLVNNTGAMIGPLIANVHSVTGPANIAAGHFVFSAPSSGTPCVFGAAMNLAPNGGSCNFKISFTPAANVGTGYAQDLITIGSAATTTVLGVWGRVQVDASFSATDPNGVVDDGVLNANDYDFGKVVSGTVSPTRTFVLKNIGERTTGAIAVNTTGNFQLDATVANNCNGSVVLPGATCNVGIQFAPAATGALAGTFVVTPTNGTAKTAHVKGTGSTNAVVTVTQAAAPVGADAPFTNHPIGGKFIRDFAIANTAATAVDAGPLAFSLMGASTEFSIDQSRTNVNLVENVPFCVPGQILAATQSCTIRVLYIPASVATVSTILNVQATPGAAGGGVNTTVSGTGIIGMLIDDLTAGGGATGGAAGKAITSTFTNPLNLIMRLTLEPNAGDTGVVTVALGANAADQGFSILTNGCANVNLSAGGTATCDVTVRFAPATAGAKTSTLTVTGTNPANVVTATLNGS